MPRRISAADGATTNTGGASAGSEARKMPYATPSFRWAYASGRDSYRMLCRCSPAVYHGEATIIFWVSTDPMPGRHNLCVIWACLLRPDSPSYTRTGMRYTLYPEGDERGAAPAEGVHVVEFWNSRCERCPQALREMMQLAAEWTDARFLCVNLSTGADEELERDLVRELSHEPAPPNVRFGYMTFAQKEDAKRAFGFSSVPHCAVLSGGACTWQGYPDKRDVVRALQMACTA